MFRRIGAAARALGVASLVAAAGCGPAAGMPQTYTTTGVVVYASGQPAKGGQVEFTSAGSDSSIRVTGEVQDDGRFSLYTLKGAAKASGAPEGEYQAEYQPPLQADPRGGVEGAHRALPAVRSAKTYKVEAKKNDFTVELPAPAGP